MIPRTFFERIGTHGVCALPAEVLSNDPLRVDPETRSIPPSLRKEAGVLGLCFARVQRCITNGLYWADVAATPDLVSAQRVVLTEEHLYHALPWDVRLVDRDPEAIRHLMFAHAQAVRPMQPLTEEEVPAQDTCQLHSLTPAPIVPLQPLAEATVAVSASDLQEAFPPPSRDDDDEFPGAGLLKRMSIQIKKPTRRKPIGSFAMQQALLRAMLDALMTQVYRAQDRLTAHLLRGRCALLALVQRWHRATRQRVVNAVPVWHDEQHCVLWHLTVGVPCVALEV